MLNGENLSIRTSETVGRRLLVEGILDTGICLEICISTYHFPTLIATWLTYGWVNLFTFIR